MMHGNPGRSRCALFAAALLCGCSISYAQKSERPVRISKPPAKPAGAPAPGTSSPQHAAPSSQGGTGAVALADAPTTIESVGMTFYPPLDSTVQSNSIGGDAVLQVIAPDESWRIDIRTPRTTNANLSAMEAGEAVLRQLLESVGRREGEESTSVQSLARVLAKTESLTTDPARPDMTGYRVYVAMPQLGKAEHLVRGYTVIKCGPSQFVGFDLTVPESKFANARPIYETVVASTRFTSAEDVAVARATAINAGLALFKQVDTEKMKEIVAAFPERWERLFTPAASGAASDDQEIAYRRIRTWVGVRGELDASRSTASYTATDREEGFIVRIDARGINAGRTVDSQSIFFMTFDRDQETWTIKNAVRDGENTATTTETGARVGKSMSVETQATGQTGTLTKPVFETDGYISQVEALLAPQIMIKAGLPTEYAFYAYQSATGQIKLRQDSMEQPPDRPGLWRLTTKIGDDARRTQASLYNDKGGLIRTELADGSVWEPVELKRLVGIWKSKGLPMD